MPSRILLLAACVLVLPWPGSAARAQDAATPFSAERPRIGLVLSGGGARGAAHVGVIQALEQMRIPIDAVAGTSMGAVVGGLYAAGLSGERDRRRCSARSTGRSCCATVRRAATSCYRRKQDDRGILARGSLGFSPGDGVVLPLGLVQGQKITQLLRNATLRVADVQDFDRLPIPFRALATDLESGEPVVLRSGDLATVLRASMSAPGVLAPGGDRRAAAGGRRAGGQPAGEPRPRDGRGRADRRGRQLPARRSRGPRVRARRHQPDDRHHGPPRHPRRRARCSARATC